MNKRWEIVFSGWRTAGCLTVFTSMTNDEMARHFDAVCGSDATARRAQAGFHAEIGGLLRMLVPEGSRVLEVGCGRGDLLRRLKPSRGLGIDLSGAMLARAREIDAAGTNEYRQSGVEEFKSGGEEFDYIVADFLVGYLPDVQAAFARLQTAASPRTRLCVTSVNVIWTPVLKVAQWCGVVTRQPPSNWLSTGDLTNLLELAGWDIVHHSTELLLPFRVPGLSWLLNGVAVRLPLLRHLGSSQYLVARPRRALGVQLSVTVVVPARNEAGNIRAALERIPVMGAWTEVIFVEGNSKDDTWATIEREVAAYRGPLRVRAMKQPGKGKWDAVHTGFAAATGDVLVIQDADLTAPPEDLPKFFAAIASGAAEFANGSRLVYPMEKEAMRFLNLLGNKFFAVALSFTLGQPIKDSLCGTKMLLRTDYERILKRIEVLGDFDPFGDFNLLFGAALLKLKIRDIPVRYKDRTYGETNISRFRHGWLLLKMTAFGLWKVKFGR